MSFYQDLRLDLSKRPRKWLITGVSGFIGSNLLEELLRLNQIVVGLDNFATSQRSNLSQVRDCVTSHQWGNFTFVEGDIRDRETCVRVCHDIDYVLHQAALGSVPRSIEDPYTTHEVNITGTLNVFLAAKQQQVKRVVYAASSSTYGDEPQLPKVENKIGKPLSPYGLTKLVNELYAGVMKLCYDLDTIGLRYFNVFGQRQDPEGAYAAVIPKWVTAMIRNQPVQIFGDGETSRDFCFIENVVQANLLGALTNEVQAVNQVYNIAFGERTTLIELYYMIRDALKEEFPHLEGKEPLFEDFRPGDIMHSHADITKAKSYLKYLPQCNVRNGLVKTLEWYKTNIPAKS